MCVKRVSIHNIVMQRRARKDDGCVTRVPNASPLQSLQALGTQHCRGPVLWLA